MKISDISINDTIITKDNINGTVIQINSILYLNNIMSKKKNILKLLWIYMMFEL